ncbi:signal peptidase I SipW [Bacillus weihaiensis]|uniref:Signal peptidase I n=1 Tax=Bacillus weihaiensis TaxID=1547283 RepID=A0A1L3MQ81_9BACI|nr:signal peptidase I [Bacillus weihaiensis]APH04414.1 signal peptidase I [Bacillus weihaiensis]
MKSIKIKKLASNMVTVVLFLALILMVFVVVTSKASGGEPQIFGYQLKTVLSGSMEPGIKTGSIIAVKPGGDMSRFSEGDVITFKQEENVLVTHRITETIKNGDQVMYRTKGDNNDSEDMEPVLSENVVAEYNGFTIPYIGYFMDFTNSKNGAFLFIIPGILLAIYSAFTIWSALSQIEALNKKDSSNVEKIV